MNTLVPLYSGHAFRHHFQEQINTNMVIFLGNEPLYSGYLFIVDTLSGNQWCPLLGGFTVKDYNDYMADWDIF